jgi:hypothetical protein
MKGFCRSEFLEASYRENTRNVLMELINERSESEDAQCKTFNFYQSYTRLLYARIENGVQKIEFCNPKNKICSF